MPRPVGADLPLGGVEGVPVETDQRPESDPQIVTINGTPGLLLRHPMFGDGTYSFDIAEGRIRAIYVVRNSDKLRGFLERTH